MAVATTKLQFFWRDASVPNQFRTGVSLHSHTMFSEESLNVIPRYAGNVPYLGAALRRQQVEYGRKTGYKLDFSEAFWTPPLAPRQAYRVEEKQIQRRLQLPGLISLTDHDDIRAPMLLRVLERFRAIPVSTEWTLPFGPTFFHVGIHNMPAAEAPLIMQRLRAFTADPRQQELTAILGMLNTYPDVLLVLNHPLWDEQGIGIANHAQVLDNLLQRHGHDLHALEVNGLRSWHENREVIRIGQQIELPLIGGGDRHGREANAIINLSCADNLVDFIHETKKNKRTHVVFMPGYAEPLKMRVLQTIVDVLREYPENLEGRRRWADRVFYRNPATCVPIPISAVWNDGGPGLIKQFVAAIRLLEYRMARSMLRFALGDHFKNNSTALIAALELEQKLSA